MIRLFRCRRPERLKGLGSGWMIDQPGDFGDDIRPPGLTIVSMMQFAMAVGTTGNGIMIPIGAAVG